ncbi:hypothetical protein [Anaerospora sp.]|uniref:hypothetical protein n=1 Tax=Anaerospora sp. TaxID=1960278 RepID=UPI0028A206FF|nr:hypothetical protein [Anaerospora sp.]
MAFDQNKPANNGTLASVDMRNNFIHIKNAVGKEHVWDDATPGNTTHRLDQIKATVTGSTQKDPTNGYDYSTSGGTAGVDLVTHTVSGIPANTYTLQSLLQELVSRSHQHVIEARLGSNCSNCSNCCNCNCGNSSCFVAGTKILMENGALKNIEEIVIGEKVKGLTGINTVLALARPLLNERDLLTFPDYDLLFSSEHCFWVNTEGGERWGTNDFNMYLREVKTHTLFIDGKQHDYGFEENPYVITGEIAYAHITGWKKQNVINLRKEHDPNIQLYQLITDNDHSMIANGYVVAAEACRYDNFSYSNVKWNKKG